MTRACETCEGLSASGQHSCSLPELRNSSSNGCEICSLLFSAVITWLENRTPLPATFPLSQDDLVVRWHVSARQIFKLDVVSNYERSGELLEVVLQLHSPRDIANTWNSISSAGVVVPDSSSDECIARIKEWLQICRSSHPKCNGIKSEWAHRVPIPAKRLVDVGDSTREPRLVQERVTRGYYVTLSHCWGLSSPLTTTKGTLNERLDGIRMQDLPQTFQDAVHLVRALGIQYLWIDSLCIVQDDEKDWKEEAGRMWDIYGASYLTIAATSAIDSSKGIFSRRASSYQVADTNLFVRKKIDHSVFRLPVRDALAEVDGEDQAAKYPLLTRGWCLQERLLSNRILHFTADEMVWQCRSCDRCECDGIQLLDSLRSSSQLTSRLKYNRVVEGNSGSDLWKIWREIVEDYCSTHLTKESDHLPALSGVAAKFGLSGGGTYIAGLWHKPGALALGSSPLFLDLLWKSSTTTAWRPVVKVAPSFSWASRVGPIKYRSEARDGPLRYQNDRSGPRKYIHKCIFVEQLTQSLDSFDQYSEAPNASLQIRCQLLPCLPRFNEQPPKIIVQSDVQYTITLDVPDTVLEEETAKLFCMPVAAYESHVTALNVFDGLVLVEISPGTYCRVGLAEGLAGKWLADSGHKIIILV